MTDQPTTTAPPAEPEPLCGNRDFDAAGRAQAARETAEWRAAVHRAYYEPPDTDAEIRARLGPEARVVGTFGGTPTGGWERMAARARLANVSSGDARPSPYHDPDSAEAENRRLGPAVTVAKTY
jgi:hypothetical protein